MKKIVIALLICGFTVTANAQTTSTKGEKIKQLMELTGAGKLGEQLSKTLLSSFQSSFPKVDATFWEEILKEIKSEDLVRLIIPIYEKYYTEQEIDQLISFYNTPVGKKTIAVSPQILQESMVAGQEWGKVLGEKVVAKLKSKGYSNE